MRVLIAEDNQQLRHVLVAALHTANYTRPTTPLTR